VENITIKQQQPAQHRHREPHFIRSLGDGGKSTPAEPLGLAARTGTTLLTDAKTLLLKMFISFPLIPRELK
jgi:hypothetical protein